MKSGSSICRKSNVIPRGFLPEVVDCLGAGFDIGGSLHPTRRSGDLVIAVPHALELRRVGASPIFFRERLIDVELPGESMLIRAL